MTKTSSMRTKKETGTSNPVGQVRLIESFDEEGNRDEYRMVIGFQDQQHVCISQDLYEACFSDDGIALSDSPLWQYVQKLMDELSRSADNGSHLNDDEHTDGNCGSHNRDRNFQTTFTPSGRMIMIFMEKLKNGKPVYVLHLGPQATIVKINQHLGEGEEDQQKDG